MTRRALRDALTLRGALTMAGQIVSRYGLVIVLAWVGFGKYAKFDARVLIGVAVWTLGDALGARATTQPGSVPIGP